MNNFDRDKAKGHLVALKFASFVQLKLVRSENCYFVYRQIFMWFALSKTKAEQFQSLECTCQ